MSVNKDTDIIDWGIIGYGINMSNVPLEEDKVASFILKLYNEQLSPNEPPFQIITKSLKYLLKYQYHLLARLTVSHPYLEWDYTLDLDDGTETHYLYLSAQLPWDSSEEYNELTERKIQDEIIRVLRPLLKEGYDSEDLRKFIGNIDTGGVRRVRKL